MTPTPVSLPSGRTSYVVRAGNGPNLVYLHGASGLIPPVDPIVGFLSQYFTVHAPIAPGYVALEEIDEIRDVHDLALHYDDVFGALGLENVPVIGHSFGGMIAAELASHCPSRVARAVLVAPTGLWNPEYPTADIFRMLPPELFEVMWGDKESAAAKAAAPMFVMPDPDHIPDEAIEMMVAITQGMASVAKFMMPLPDKGLSRRLYRMRASTLVLWGNKDTLAPPAYAQDFVRAIPDARAEIIDGAGHMVMLERPEQSFGAILKFLS
jgi:pimeloyl-ACP methyl ester carboxylesterase